MTATGSRVTVSLLLCVILVGCSSVELPPAPVYPEGPIVDENGHPMPAQGWGVISFWGVLSNANYYNTGGPWYIIIENNQIAEDKFTQVFLNQNPAQPDKYAWFYVRNFEISDKYIYIEDPIKAFFGWTYYVIVYEKYYGE